jgi:uncharacterized membrane protein
MWMSKFFARIREALKIRKRILTGILTIVPMAVTVWVIYILGANFHKIFKPIISRYLYIESPFLGFCISFVLMLLAVYIIGFLSAFLVVKKMIAIGEKILNKIPFVKVLYSSTKQVIDSLTLPQRKVFKKVVIIEYPRKGFHAIAFATGETLLGDNREKLVSIFMPTTPNPTTGFLFMLPENEIRETDMSVSDGMKILLSGGILVQPQIPVRPYVSDLESEDKLSRL